MKMKCKICGKPITGCKMTCSDICHELFVKLCENAFGVNKKVVDEDTGIAYRVPVRDIIEKGLKWEDLNRYPIWDDFRDVYIKMMRSVN
jgi:hypothetical protein